MKKKKKWLYYSTIAAIAVVLAFYGQKERSGGIVEAKEYVPQPLIVLDGGTIIYNDAPDCH